MGRERRVVGPSAATPPHRFEVDLTSVCVRRGAVQLPFRLQGAFAEGPVAAVDNDGGATLDLRFRPPRELQGLQPFFEAHGLRANDRMGFIFTDGGLRVEAIKRERKAPASAVERPQAPPPRGSHDRPRRTPADARRDAGSAAPPDRAPVRTPSSAAPSAPPSLRMASPPPSVPAEEPRGDGAHDVGRPTPHWEPLDVTASPESADGPELESTRGVPSAHGRDEPPVAGDGTPHVREIRRGALLGAQPPHAPASTGTEVPESDVAYASEEAPARRAGRPEEGRSSGTQRGRGPGLFGLRRRLGFGRSERWRPEQDRPAATWEGEPARDLPQAPGVRSMPAEIDPSGPADLARTPPEAPEPRATPVGVADEIGEARSAAPSREDIAAVAAYLARPDVPAIVRAERVAEELALTYERVDAALDRISEESDQLSHIRAGAYMLRRGPTR